MHNGVLCEELAIALSLNSDTRGETVFQEVKTYFETNAIPLINVIACATDWCTIYDKPLPWIQRFLEIQKS